MSCLKILHVASFSGNIGDNASHIGLSNILRKYFPNYKESRLEIRRFYKNYTFSDKLAFDDNFVKYANSFDLLIIGGGGFLDYWVPNSETGTTIDISHDNLDNLIVPTLICSVGSIPHREVPKGNEDKFRNFLVHLLSKRNIKILLRNDGSKDVIVRCFGKEFDTIPTILDNAFFYKNDAEPSFVITKNKYIAINTTFDQLKMKNNTRCQITEDTFNREMLHYIEKILSNTDFHIVMVPHIFLDVSAIYNNLLMLPDRFLRTRIHIAPYSQGDYACNMIFSVYQNSHYNIGMRFHSNVCSLAMGKPISGLAVLDRIQYMHKYVGNDESVVDISNPFSEVLYKNTLEYGGTVLPENVIQNIINSKQQSIKEYKRAFDDVLNSRN